MIPPAVRVLGVAVAAGGLLACSSDPRSGYAHASSFDTSISTVAVPVFDNTTFSGGLEVQLTEALIKEIHRSTPWRVTSEARADALLTGTITGASLDTLSTNADSGLVQELGAEVVASFEWRDQRTGRVMAARRNFRSSEPFVPAQGAQERLALGERSSIDRLAKDIVATLRTASW